MWSAAPPGALNPMMRGTLPHPPPQHWQNNPQAMQQFMQQQQMGGMHRSMHDLHLQGHPGFQQQQAFHQQGRAGSPGATSQRSRGSKMSHMSHRLGNGKQQQQQQMKASGRSASSSRPHSRSGGRMSSNRGRQEYSESDEESEDEDFFTGESEMDFVSLSSGSNSRRNRQKQQQRLGSRTASREQLSSVQQQQQFLQPTRPWMCEHCTYVNAPGEGGGGFVCAMCSKTSAKAKQEAAMSLADGGGDSPLSPQQNKVLNYKKLYL